MRRTAAVGALVACLLLAFAAPVGAHVEVGPEQAEAGSTTTLTFSFHHGKDGAPTTGLEVRLPDGAQVLDVPVVAGWTSNVSGDGTTVIWAGGSVPDGTEAEFPIVVRLPPDAGVVLFPTIQTTAAGELAWISPDEGEGEDEHPAPRVELTPSTTQATSSTSTTTTEGDASTTTQAPRDLPRTILEAEQRDDGGGSMAPWVIGSGVAAAVVIAVGGTILKRRSG